MNESTGESPKNINESTTSEEVSPLDNAFTAFSYLHEDDWSERINVGVPLYEKLVAAGDARADEVRGELQYLSDVMKNSGAGDPATKASYLERLSKVTG